MQLNIIGSTNDPWANALLACMPKEPKQRTILLVGAHSQAWLTLAYRLTGFRVLWIATGDIQSGITKRLLRGTSRLAHAILAPNQAIETHYLKLGASDKKISLIYPPCVPQAISPPQNKEEFTIACDGETDTEHGLGTIMRAVRDAQDILGNIKLVIGGAISDRNRIEWLARELGMRDIIQLAPSKNFDWLASCDLFLFLRNNNASVPISASYALAFGVPIICNDALRHREFIQHQVQGILLKDINTDMLSQAIINLGRKPEWRAELSREAVHFAHGRFNPEIARKKIEALIP